MAVEHPSFSLDSLEAFSQPTLLEAEQPEEVMLENCVVMSRPTYKRHGENAEWSCSMFASADIFHQDRAEFVEVHATTHAALAQRKHVKPGDRVNLTGVVQQQEIELGNGDKKIVNHVTVSDMQVIGRAKRLSITVFELKQGK